MADNKAQVNPGIDYGRGLANVDKANGIRFGVISWHSIMLEAIEDMEADYGKPTCPKCQGEANSPDEFGETFQNGIPADYTDEEFETSDYVCVNCKHFFGSESAFGDEPLGHYYDKDGYKLESHGNDGFGIFVTLSPYYTYARFCSPCAPGAGDLDSPLLDASDAHPHTGLPKVYCLGHDWFEESRAPYRVFKVSDDSEVIAEAR